MTDSALDLLGGLLSFFVAGTGFAAIFTPARSPWKTRFRVTQEIGILALVLYNVFGTGEVWHELNGFIFGVIALIMVATLVKRYEDARQRLITESKLEIWLHTDEWERARERNNRA
jgi:peptidoglycan/LPS O-acetylase OafA/YrhL